MKNAKKRIVMLLGSDFIHPYPDPRVYKEAKSMVENGYDISVVCWCKDGSDLPDTEIYEGINISRVFQKAPHYRAVFLWRLPFYALYILKSVRKTIKLRPDAVHCHDLDTLMIGVIVKLLRRKPLIFDAHEDYPSVLEGTYSRFFIRAARLFEKILIKMVDRVIAAEEPYVPIQQKHYGITPVVIRNFPRLDGFHPAVDPSPVVSRYGLEGKTVISHIGIVGRARGIFETLEAIHSLDNADIRLFIIGRAPENVWDTIRETMNKLNLEKAVILIEGGVDYKDIPLYYKASDISLALLYPMPNYVTSIPTKLYESLAVGVPVLAGNLDYLSSIVTKYDVGLCADSQDPADIAAKLGTMIADKAMRERMSRNGLKVIKEEFNWAESEKRLLGLYREILAK